MTSPFKSISNYDCRAKDLFDALTIIHDLDLWDELTYEFAENPKKLIDHVNENVDEFVKEWEAKNIGWSVRFIDTFKKINAIKHIRKWSNLGLALSKRIIESCPFIYPWYFNSKEKLLTSQFYKELIEFNATNEFEVIQLTPKQREICVSASNTIHYMYGTEPIDQFVVTIEHFNKLNGWRY